MKQKHTKRTQTNKQKNLHTMKWTHCNISASVDVSLSVCMYLLMFSNTIAANLGSSIRNRISTQWNVVRNWLFQPRQSTSDTGQPGTAFLPCLSVCQFVCQSVSLSMQKLNKKLSYRRESAHLTSLYRTVQKAFRDVEVFRHESRV